MPYKTISDLPKNVKHVLPKHAQEIFKEAFNSAWSAVKKKYKKNESSGQWESKD